MNVCVCVCEREREREYILHDSVIWRIVFCLTSVSFVVYVKHVILGCLRLMNYQYNYNVYCY